MLAYAPLEMQPSYNNSKAPITNEYVLPKTENKGRSGFNSHNELIENQIKRNKINWLNSIFPIVKNKFAPKDVDNLLFEILTQLLTTLNITNPSFSETSESLLIQGLKNENLFHLEVFPDEEFEFGYDAKINVIKNRKIILHSSGTISELFGKL